MKALFAIVVMLSTVLLAISIGIVAGYAAICGILNAFSAQRDKAVASAHVAPAPTVGD